MKCKPFPAVTKPWPHIRSHYWAMDMFRCFTPKENIIRIWERISLFPHVRSSEVMATQPQPPSLTESSALDLTFSLPGFRNIHTYTRTDTHKHALYISSFEFWKRIYTSANYFEMVFLFSLFHLDCLCFNSCLIWHGLIIGSGPSETRNNLFWSELSFHFP